MNDDDRWPELNAGDPHMADVSREPIKVDRPRRRDFGFFVGVGFVLVIDLLMLAIFEAWRGVPWLH